jgi:8-oxo-dGTP pyrophosphatase MutT (NUDIX family)
MTFHAAVTRLESAFREGLPGAAAHAHVAPRPRRQWPAGFDPARIRQAAGLLLVFPIENRAHLLLTLRAGTLGHHGGQVSLPGGSIEPGESIEQAALREAREEVALETTGARVLGRLTPIDIPVSSFRLHPVVAAIARRPALEAARGEVARILEVAIDELLDRRSLISAERARDGQPIAVPAFRAADHEIWGATAMVVAELLVMLGWDGAVL